jgi:hypothetical protein
MSTQRKQVDLTQQRNNHSLALRACSKKDAKYEPNALQEIARMKVTRSVSEVCAPRLPGNCIRHRNPKRERGISSSLTFRVMIGEVTTYGDPCNFLLRVGLPIVLKRLTPIDETSWLASGFKGNAREFPHPRLVRRGGSAQRPPETHHINAA